MNNNKFKQNITLYVRNRKTCEYSAITKKCDKLLFKKNFSFINIKSLYVLN